MQPIKLYLHIGYHKTGTTALQHFLQANRAVLRRKGYLYPASGLQDAGQHRLAWSLDPGRQLASSPEELWEELAREISSSGLSRVILSAEDFCVVPQLDQLRELVRRYSVQCIVYLRRQDHLIQSVYNQMVKVRPDMRMSLEQLLDSQQFDGYLDFRQSLARWREAFGTPNIKVRVYERDQLPDGICADFLRAIDLCLDKGYRDQLAHKDSNPSLSREMVELVRRLNWLRISERARKTLLRRIRQHDQRRSARGLFSSQELLSPTARIRLLQAFSEINQQVAIEYLGRPDGMLFYEPWPDPQTPWQRVAIDYDLADPVLVDLKRQHPELIPQIRQCVEGTLAELGTIAIEQLRMLFSASFYLERNPDVAAAGMTPLYHYLRIGAAEGRDPHPLFDTSFYLEQSPDVAAAGVNPLCHYLRRGAAEGRDPHPLFDTSFYLERNPDVAAAGMNPLCHYLRRGAAEGRAALASPESQRRKEDQSSSSSV